MTSSAAFHDDDEVASRPVSPLAPDQRLYKPLPKRSRLSQDGDSYDGNQLPTWVPGKEPPVLPPATTETDDHPALDTATSSTDNDIDLGPPTPPITTSSDPYNSIFSSVHSLVKDAAAATTLFGGAADQIGVPLPTERPARPPREPEEDDRPSAGQFARMAAAAGILLDDEDPRDEDGYTLDERREDEYGFRRGTGGNKKKRKVPGATDGHAFSSPPPSPGGTLPAPASVHGVGGLGREGETLGLRANFATAMVGVVKAMGSTARIDDGGHRVPYSSPKRRRQGQPPRRPPKPTKALSIAPYKPFAPPSPKSSKKAKKAAKVEPLQAISLPNLYDPQLPVATALVPAKGKTAPPSRPKPPRPLFLLPSIEYTFACTSSSTISVRLAELNRERVKLKRARELILERARELDNVRQQGVDEDGKMVKRSADAGASSKATPASKTYTDASVQTDGGAPGGREIYVTPRTTGPNAIGGRKPPPRKGGKKKRAAHANANNVHHRDNYVPSRPVRSSTAATSTRQTNTAVPMLRPGASLDLVDPNSPFYVSGPESHPQLGNSGLTPFFAGMEEWLCTFCEAKILYGSTSNVSEMVRKRKGVLKVRKRAQERAAKAASGQTGKEKAAKAKDAAAKRAARQTADAAVGPDDSATESEDESEGEEEQ